jgi:FKBP-type peptidyl-prolyl cis-trans isomerase FklB
VLFFIFRPQPLYAGSVKSLLHQNPLRLAALLALLAFAPALAAPDALSAVANQGYLADNAKKPGVVVLPSGLQYRIVRGGFGKRVGPRDVVQVQFSGSLINGAVIDGSSPGLPSTLAVGSVIRGLGEALQLMHVGDHWQLTIPPGLAFGAAGSGTTVPPNQTLLFDITLTSVATPSDAAVNDPQISLSPMNRDRGTYREQGAILTIPQ